MPSRSQPLWRPGLCQTPLPCPNGALLANAVAPVRTMALCIEVHMVGVKRIGARPEHRRKPTASRCPRPPDIRRFIGAILMLPRDAPLVRKPYREKIYRDPFGVGTDLAVRKVIPIATLIAGAGLDRLDLRSERSRAEWRHDHSDIIGEDEREFALEDRSIGQTDDIAVRQRDRVKSHRRRDAATFGDRLLYARGLRSSAARYQFRQACLICFFGPFERRRRCRWAWRRGWREVGWARGRQGRLCAERGAYRSSKSNREGADHQHRL